MTEKKISRRDAMKMLGVAVGAAALSTLPSKWNTPELVAGVLPAHARQSGGPGTQLHTFLEPLSLVDISPGSGYLDASRQIFPPDGGIVLAYNIIIDGSITLTVPNSGTITTNSSGYAQFLDLYSGAQTFDSINMIFTFQNPAEGTDSSQVGVNVM
jgi:hypothetical protein